MVIHDDDVDVVDETVGDDDDANALLVLIEILRVPQALRCDMY